MKKWIRWWGIAAFIAIILIGFITWYLLADKIIANKIEESGEYIFGAKVEVSQADLTLFPLSVNVSGLRVANPNSPMKNLLDIDKVLLYADREKLLERKLIISDLVVEGIKLNTDRTTSGEIKGADSYYQHVYDEFVLPILDLSNLKSLIEKEELPSLKSFNFVIEDIERVKTEWEYSYQSLPTMDDVHQYRKRTNIIAQDIQKNKIKGLLPHGSDIKLLKDEIERDIANLRSNKKAMEVDIDSLQTKKSRAISSVISDINNLKDKYTFDFKGINNFSKYFFKEEFVQRIGESLQFYDKLHPYFQVAYTELRNGYTGNEPILFEGIDVQFPDFDVQPSFFIESAKLIMDPYYGDIIGELENITNEQNITGQPIIINFNGKNLDFAESVNIGGMINRVKSDNKIDSLSIKINKQKIKQTRFGINKDWSININDGLTSKNIDVKIVNGNIKSKIHFDYNDTSINSDYRGEKNIIISTINSLLLGINEFYIDVNITGNIDDYDISIRSDLDNRINNSVTNLVQTEADKVKSIINDVVNEKKKNLVQQIELELEKLSLELVKVEDILVEIKKIIPALP